MWKRIKSAAKALKRQVLAVHYATQDPECGWLPRVCAALTLAYALSPIDLIPDFIPVLGLVDDIVILPLMIWGTVKLIPDAVMQRGIERAQHEPLRLHKNWGMALLFFLAWDALFAWLAWAATAHWGGRVSPWLGERPWVPAAAVAGVAVVVEAAWCAAQWRKAHRGGHEEEQQQRQQQAAVGPAAAVAAEENDSSSAAAGDLAAPLLVPTSSNV